MHICLLCTEIFRWGKYGGFGRATRVIGRELARRGVKVSAVIPLPRGSQEAVREEFDGITVYGYPVHETWSSQALYKEVDADIYHTEEPFLGTYLARRAMPAKAHVVTFRDPRSMQDWWTEFRFPTRSRLQTLTTWVYYENPLVRQAVRRCHGWGVAAEFLTDKAMRKYRLREPPTFLPSPIAIPDRVEKAARPTACFVGRFDRVKRPELFFELARQHPEVEFIAIGASQDDQFSHDIQSGIAMPSNLTLTGFIDQFKSKELYEHMARSWILVNTSAKEGLPNAFIEAAAHQCAILSTFDPDGFTSKFGCLVPEGEYSSGLTTLLRDNLWRERGADGQAYVRSRFSTDVVIDRHVQLYDDALSSASR